MPNIHSTFLRSHERATCSSKNSLLFLQSFTLALACSISLVSCADEPDKLTVDEIANSIEVGSDVEQSLPFGLPIYPDAKVKASMLGGFTSLLETDATAEKIAIFYVETLKERGLDPEGPELNGQHVRVTTVWESNPSATLEILVREAEQPDLVTITFAKIPD